MNSYSSKPMALLFPGQGSEALGMSKGWEQVEAWNSAMDRAESHSGLPLREWMSAGPDECVKDQGNSPVIIISHSIGIFLSHSQVGMPRPAMAAGHSLGFYAALVAAGAIPLETVIDLVMDNERTAKEKFGRGQYGMAYLIGIKAEALQDALENWPELHIANVNSNAQFTVSGVLDALNGLLSQVGGQCLHSGLLPVTYPLHGPMMKAVSMEVKKRMSCAKANALGFSLVSHVDGRIISDGQEAWDEALESITLPVVWPSVINSLVAHSCAVFECGFGKQLANLCRWVQREMVVESLSCPP